MTRSDQRKAAQKALQAHLSNNKGMSRQQAIDEAVLRLYGRCVKRGDK